MTGAVVWDCVKEQAGAGARGGAGTQGGDLARDGAGRQVHLLVGILQQVLVLLRGFWAAAEGEDPAQLDVEDGAQAWGQLYSIKYVGAAGQHLAEPGTAKVLQGGGCIAGTDHLHAAFSCCGAHHGVELLVLQPCGSDTYTVPILVEGQGTMPGVQVHSYDGALAKPRGELHFVPFVLELSFEQIEIKNRMHPFIKKVGNHCIK